jgi:hypothetical protein
MKHFALKVAALSCLVVGAMSLPGAAHTAEKPNPAPVRPTVESTAQDVSATDVDLPTFKPGLWQYERRLTEMGSITPKRTSAQRCVDPTAEIRKKRSELAGKGCQFTPMRVTGNRYFSTWRCETERGVVRFRNSVTVESPSHYVDNSQSRTQDKLSEQVIEATRIGDCKVPQSTSRADQGVK